MSVGLPNIPSFPLTERSGVRDRWLWETNMMYTEVGMVAWVEVFCGVDLIAKICEIF